MAAKFNVEEEGRVAPVAAYFDFDVVVADRLWHELVELKLDHTLAVLRGHVS